MVSTEHETCAIGIGCRVIRNVVVGSGKEHGVISLQENRRTTEHPIQRKSLFLPKCRVQNIATGRNAGKIVRRHVKVQFTRRNTSAFMAGVDARFVPTWVCQFGRQAHADKKQFPATRKERCTISSLTNWASNSPTLEVNDPHPQLGVAKEGQKKPDLTAQSPSPAKRRSS